MALSEVTKRSLHCYLVLVLTIAGTGYILIWGTTSRPHPRIDSQIDEVPSEEIPSARFDYALNEGRPNNDSIFSSNAFKSRTLRPNKGFLTIGIPTIKRPNCAGYIIETLEGLIRNTNAEEKKGLILLVFLADTDPVVREELRNILRRQFGDHIQSGLIQIIQAPTEFYPSFDHLETLYGKYSLKEKWISKQNFDYAFMMMQAKGMSELYLQLEDDVSTVPGYIGIIKHFMAEQKSNWTCLEFSVLGFIAKLYHCYDLEKLSKLLMLFYHEQPNDVNYLHFNQINRQEHRIVRKPTIFKHLGLHSSLPGKIQTRGDPLFENETKDVKHSEIITDKNDTLLNPPAKIVTTLKYFQGTPEKCYSNEGPLWTHGPGKGSRLTIVFDKPQYLSNVTIISGSDDHPEDFVQHGILQIGQNTDRLYHGQTVCSDIIVAQVFSQGRVIVRLEKAAMDLESYCVQIWFTKSHNTWLMLTKIAIYARKR